MTKNQIKKIVSIYFTEIVEKGFILEKNILYKISNDSLLLGLCFESSASVKDSLYIWSFVLPLYLKNDVLSLTFGQRLENKLWQFDGENIIDTANHLLPLLQNEIKSFFPRVDTSEKFYLYYIDKCVSLRMYEAVVYSSIYINDLHNRDLVTEFIDKIMQDNISIEWIKNLLDEMTFLKSMLDNKAEVAKIMGENIFFSKQSLKLQQ